MRAELIFAALFGLVANVFANDLERYEDLNSIVGDSILQLQSLRDNNPHSECLRKALGNIIFVCKEKGLESLSASARTLLALRLTICEMESLKLEPPVPCFDTLIEAEQYQVDECIAAIEKIPQYWTIFSGNYREIRKICFEESVPYQKDDILNLYNNITRVFLDLNTEMSRSSEITEQIHIKFKQKFDILLQSMRDLTSEIYLSKDKMSKEFQDAVTVVKDSFSDSLQLIQTFKVMADSDLSEISVNLNFLGVEFLQLRQSLQDLDISKSMTNLKQEVSDNCDDIVASVSLATGGIKTHLEALIGELNSRDKSDEELRRKLQQNMKLSLDVSSILQNVHSNALQQVQAYTEGNDQISIFMNQILSGLEALFTNIDERLNEYLNVLDKRASDTLSKLEAINCQVDVLRNYFRVGAQLSAKVSHLWRLVFSSNYFSQVSKTLINKAEQIIDSVKNFIDKVKIGFAIILLVFVKSYKWSKKPNPFQHQKQHKSQLLSKIIIFITVSLMLALLILTAHILILIDSNNNVDNHVRASLRSFFAEKSSALNIRR